MCGDNESMSGSQTDNTKFWLRIGSGVLAAATLLLVIFRIVAISKGNLLAGDNSFVHILRLIFPLSLSLLFGYIAWKGKLPFSKKS